MLIVGQDRAQIGKLKEVLVESFDMKDLSPAKILCLLQTQELQQTIVFTSNNFLVRSLLSYYYMWMICR